MATAGDSWVTMESVGAVGEDSLELCVGCQENPVPHVSAGMDELKECYRGVSKAAFILLAPNNPQSDSSEVEQLNTTGKYSISW